MGSESVGPPPPDESRQPARSTDGTLLTPRGERTRQKILDAAEEVFADLGWDVASVVKITERAGVAQGSFYRYFDTKQAIFDEVVGRFNQRVRQAMQEGAATADHHIESERRGFDAYFRFAEQNPRLYRVIRQAEFASPGSYRKHYERIAEGYIANLSQARDRGEVDAPNPEVTAYILMAVGELVGQRWIVWGDGKMPEDVFEHMMAFVERGLTPRV